MKIILKFVCLISVISIAHCAQFCSNKINGDKGECLSHEVCAQNNPILNASCEADRSCCSLKFFHSNCEDGLPTIFMLYGRNDTHTMLVCSGTLINSVYILTAAHCINDDSNSQVFAKIHGSDTEFKISKHYIFPGFANNETHRMNDVGLFRLEEAIDTSIVKTVCLGTRNKDLKKETFTISGYDRDTKSIKQATTSFYDNDDCKSYLDTNQFEHTISFDESFCYDDTLGHVPNFVSGSPIMVKEGNKYYQYGIATLGAIERSDKEITPAISPKLSIYQGWIIKAVTEFCFSAITDEDGECYFHEVCKPNNPILNTNCGAELSCCKLNFSDNNCEDGLPTIFMVYERRNDTNTKLICSGTLISSVYILTAAHCINNESTFSLFAKIHGSDTEFKISKHYIFPGYANNSTHKLEDVGLFRLEQAIDSSINVKTICLQKRHMDVSKKTLYIYGYDRDSKAIKEATTSFNRSDKCLMLLIAFDWKLNISVQGAFCYNDAPIHVPDFLSGAPIMVKDGNKYYQYGMTALRPMDRADGEITYAISPKLSIYQGWIVKAVTEFCSSKTTGERGKCLSHEVCKSNIPIQDANCEADRSCCSLKFFDNKCEEGLPTIFMLYEEIEKPKLTCTGVLINSLYILTTAHCVHERLDIKYSAKIYGSDREFKISNSYRFPGFANNETHRFNDVGLFRLEQAIDPSINAKTICLSNQNMNLSKKLLYIYGYDRELESIKEATTSLYSPNSYSDFLNTHSIDLDISFQDSFCFDDTPERIPRFLTGAPIMVKDGNKYYQHGIVTWGIESHHPGMVVPGFSPKLSIYQGWILMKIAEFCSSAITGEKGECYSHEVCEPNNPILNASCGADLSCCKLNFSYKNCEDGLPTIFMLYERRNDTNTKLICSGTLISSVYILTAAHCIINGSTFPLFAKISGSDSEFKISKHYIFPGYANNATHIMKDVGLFRLEEAINSSINAKTICLPNQNLDLSGKTFHVYGYDRDSKVIKEATTSFYDTDKCLEYLNTYNFDHSFSIQTSFCYDDAPNHVPDFVSGSPIMVKEGNKYYQYGISSLGVVDRVVGQTIPALSPKLSIYL
ncbi:unnamed protein product [Diamesa tonsa]